MNLHNENIKKDLDYLNQVVLKIKTMVNGVNKHHLVCLGEIIFQISHQDDNKLCIRNLHGFVNPSDSGKKNEYGAKLDFFTLSHLKYIQDGQLLDCLLGNQTGLFSSFEVISKKIGFIKDFTSETDGKKEDSDIGFLRDTLILFHDLKSIILIEKMINNVHKFNIDSKEERYAMGRSLCIMGEAAKELSDRVKLDNIKCLTTLVIGKIKNIRDIIKGNQWILDDRETQGLFKIKLVLDEAIHSGLGIFIGSLVSHLQIVANNFTDITDYGILDFEHSYPVSVFVSILKELALKDDRVVFDFPSIVELENKITKELEITKKENLWYWLSDMNENINSIETKNKKLFKVLMISDPNKFETSNVIQFVKLVQKKNAGQVTVKDVPDFQIKKYETSIKNHVNVLSKKLKKLETYNIADIGSLVSINTSSDSWLEDLFGLDINSFASLHFSTILPTSLLAEKEHDVSLVILKSILNIKSSFIFSTKNEPQLGNTFKQLVYKIIDHTQFLCCLNEKTTSTENSVLATEMSLGYLGELHKLLHSNKFINILEFVPKDSILSQDIHQIIKTRHEKLMHNIVNNQDSNLGGLVRDNIVPWNNDIKHIRFFTESDEEVSNLVKSQLPVGLRIDGIQSDIVFSKDNNTKCYLLYLRIVAMNRFLIPDKAMAAYNFLISLDIMDGISPVLEAEIHWEASLSYRNLGNFDQCLLFIEKSLNSIKKETNENEMNFKKCSYELDYGIALIQLNKNKEADEYFSSVSLNNLASTHQVLVASFLRIVHNTLKDSFLELNFSKHFNSLSKCAPVSALSFLNAMANKYMDSYDLINSNSTIDYLKSFHKQIESYSKETEGQSKSFFDSMVMNTVGRFELLKNLVEYNGMSTEDLFGYLQREKFYRESVPGSITSNQLNQGLFSAAILNGNYEFAKSLNVFETPVKTESSFLFKKSKSLIQEIESKVYSLGKLNTKTRDYFLEKKNIGNLVSKLTATLFLHAFQELHESRHENSKVFIRKSILFQYIDMNSSRTGQCSTPILAQFLNEQLKSGKDKGFCADYFKIREDAIELGKFIDKSEDDSLTIQYYQGGNTGILLKGKGDNLVSKLLYVNSVGETHIEKTDHETELDFKLFLKSKLKKINK